MRGGSLLNACCVPTALCMSYMEPLLSQVGFFLPHFTSEDKAERGLVIFVTISGSSDDLAVLKHLTFKASFSSATQDATQTWLEVTA